MILLFHKDSLYPSKKLIELEPYEKAKTLMIIDNFQRVILDQYFFSFFYESYIFLIKKVAALLYKALKFKTIESFNEIDKVLDSYEKILGENYFFGGKTTGIIDYMIWPW